MSDHVREAFEILQAEGLVTPLWFQGGLSQAFYEDDPDDHDGRFWLIELPESVPPTEEDR